jgi:hypothetical protein
MTEQYQLEKPIWTEDDFEHMGWHDARVHAIAFLSDTSEVALDIDYIFEWVERDEPSKHYLFWVAPCTLVFGNVIGLELDLAPHEELTINEITRADPGVPRNAAYIGKSTDWKWTINSHDGALTFRSAGFTQYVRQSPVLGRQSIPLESRGGISFDRSSATGVNAPAGDSD